MIRFTMTRTKKIKPERVGKNAPGLDVMVSIPEKLEHIVFAGGGMRGLAYAGALQALQHRGYDLCSPLRDLQSVSGSSIGALFAMCVAARMSVDHMLLEVRRFNIREFIDIDPYLLFCRQGLDMGHKMEAFIEKLLLQLTGDAHIRMYEFFLSTKVRLVIPVTDLEAGKVIYLDYREAPEMRVAEAVKISMTLPFIFTPHRFRGHLCVDGGLMDNFPMHLFPPGSTLGIRPNWVSGGPLDDSFSQYCSRLLYCAFASCENQQWRTLHPLHQQHTVQVDVGNVKVVEFDFSSDQIQNLIQIGYNAIAKPPRQQHCADLDTVNSSLQAMVHSVCCQVALQLSPTGLLRPARRARAVEVPNFADKGSVGAGQVGHQDHEKKQEDHQDGGAERPPPPHVCGGGAATAS